MSIKIEKTENANVLKLELMDLEELEIYLFKQH